ncbi:MAG: polysaccharide deacetylase family protein [Clostridia bacterium]|nr:polysaccharide deacetylase family protein [Clostridia bacterium]
MFLTVKKVLLLCILPCLFLFACSAPPLPETESSTPSNPPVLDAPSPVAPNVWTTDKVDISRVCKDKKLIALTFDDAPTKKLGALLDVFLTHNNAHPDCPATATLFCNGYALTAPRKETLYTAFAMGMELGNHTFSHRDLTTLSSEELDGEIDAVDVALQEIDGQKRHLFRAPYGRISAEVVKRVDAPIIDWYIDTNDWKELSPQGLVERVLDRLQDGAIVLMHDGYDETIEGVERLLNVLDEKGYQAVTVSQMAKTHGCLLRTGKVYTRARKQHRI